VLATLGTVLRKNLRRSDTIARYGGEEFAVLLADLASSDALRLIDRIRGDFAEVAHTDEAGHRFTITFSAGVAAIPSTATEFETWTAAADCALYVAKSEGRNRVALASDE
jgi:diguanylate cyclase (GGDEF)-like protein